MSLGRRRLPVDNPKLTQRVVDFALLGPLPPADDVFCALGTTMAKAGTKEAFRAVDFDAVLSLAKSARAAGTERFVLVSSAGANAKSYFLYPRTKGEIEAAVSGLGFEAVYLLRPSFLLGERGEHRAVERALSGLLKFAAPAIPARWRAIEAEKVSRAALALAKSDRKGANVIESDALQSLGG